MERETVEQFLARGGKIQHIPRGEGKEQIKLKRSGKSDERVVYVTGKTSNYNGKGKDQAL